MPHPVIYRSLLPVVMLLLGSCAPPGPQASLQRFEVTPLMLTLVFEGSCDNDPQSLETWIGTVSAARQNVVRIVDDALDKESIYVALEVEALVNMRNGLSQIPAPDCAVQAHTLLASIVDRALEIVQGYANGELVSHQSQYQQMRVAVQQFDTILKALTDRLYDLTVQGN